MMTRLKAVHSGEAGLARLFRSYEGHVLRANQFMEGAGPLAAGFQPVWITPLTDVRFELLVTDRPVTVGMANGIEIKRAGDVAYFEIRQEEGKSLRDAAETAYRTVFATRATLPGYRLLRIWNYVPRILEGAGERERYRLFNAGRFAAWQACGPTDAAGNPGYPAATGIGSHGGPLIVQVLLSKAPVRHVQNYRQIPSPGYSRAYGALPPAFARASLRSGQGAAELVVSGTASILGEDTVHDTPEGQAEETLRNLEALLSRENLGTVEFGLDRLHSLRAYVKRPEELPAIRRVLEPRLRAEQIVYLLDDICRPGLLLEVEGIATAP